MAKQNRIGTPNLCKCEAPAVAKPPSLLRKTCCQKCGKIFSTNRNSDICYKCERAK